ncbi:MAG: hypothetical protein JST39_08230, partial [Bacteroidetes bacterium]|nr:hypothetical protein [Bacteroidota bacterium]
LVYPLPFIDIFHVDWKAPKEVLLLDYRYARYGPIVGPMGGLYELPSMHFHTWFFPWLRRLFTIFTPIALILVAALCSPLLRLAAYAIKRKTAGLPDLLYWLVYVMLWAWLLSSPDARFGMGALSLCIALPLMLGIGSRRQISAYALPVLLSVFTVYYLVTAVLFFGKDRQKRLEYGTVNDKNPWIYPLQHPAYVRPLLKEQPYVLLGNGVRMYHAIPGQPCNERCFPCMPWFYGDIEMRGKNIEDGFRNTRVSIPKGHPVSPGILPLQ